METERPPLRLRKSVQRPNGRAPRPDLPDNHDGFLYAADSFDGLLWRIPVGGGDSDSDSGSGLPEIWSNNPLLQVAPGSPFSGPRKATPWSRAASCINRTGGLHSLAISRLRRSAAFSRSGMVSPASSATAAS